MEERIIRPLILVRGFGGPDVSDEQASPYQGFNDGTVYPSRRGDNYIYEGFVLRALKSDQYPYRDATNVVGYYAKDVEAQDDSDGWYSDLRSGTVVVDAAMANQVLRKGASGTIWIYRYYDLEPRDLPRFGEGLANLVHIIQKAGGDEFAGVDVVAHSMGGLVVRAALRHLNEQGESPADLVHRIVTLGTPHRGIAFQRLPQWLVDSIPTMRKAADEFAAFDPTKTGFRDVGSWFPIERILCVVGTDYRSYGARVASLANRLSSLMDDGSLLYNRSDGLVKQSSAQLPGAPRTFVHKCHGGKNSLVTSREAYEIAMRFFHGTHRVRLWLDEADISRGKDMFGRSEFYFGASIKPRGVDFELFHQSADAENCYGAFRDSELREGPPPLEGELLKSLAASGDATTGWAGPDRLVWEGWVDASVVPESAVGLVFRLDLFVGERDSYGVGFSDNVVFRKQYYVQVILGSPPILYVHTGERHLNVREPTQPDELAAQATADPRGEVQRAQPSGTDGEWRFNVRGTGFEATFRVAVNDS